jgi:hypothetical protein
MNDAEQEGLPDQPDPGLQQPAEQQLLAEGREQREHRDAGDTDATRKRPELRVQPPRPGEATDAEPRHHHHQTAESQAHREAVRVSGRITQRKPRLGVRERGAVAPDDGYDAADHAEKCVRHGEATPPDHRVATMARVAGGRTPSGGWMV